MGIFSKSVLRLFCLCILWASACPVLLRAGVSPVDMLEIRNRTRELELLRSRRETELAAVKDDRRRWTYFYDAHRTLYQQKALAQMEWKQTEWKYDDNRFHIAQLEKTLLLQETEFKLLALKLQEAQGTATVHKLPAAYAEYWTARHELARVERDRIKRESDHKGYLYRLTAILNNQNSESQSNRVNARAEFERTVYALEYAEKEVVKTEKFMNDARFDLAQVLRLSATELLRDR